MSIAHQSATPVPPKRARLGLTRAPHGLVTVDEPALAWTIAKIAGLLFLTAITVALVSAIVAGTAFFAILNFG